MRGATRPGARNDAYVTLLGQRLAAFTRGELPAPTLAERRLAAAFLRPREGTWHDGDENLVRGRLDGWGAADEGTAAGQLLAVADELATIRPRPQTLWFYLWAMESALARE